MNQLWSIRSLAVGLVGKMPGVKKPVAFVEDAIVPPHNLAAFVSDLQQMLDRDGFNYAMYGHVDVGCIHVRPALNMQNVEDRDKIRPITLEVIELLKKYNGILWGEHGKGFRGEFVPETFGPILYPILCKIKALFDPNNRMNPGKLATPDPQKFALLRIEQVPMRGQYDQVINQVEQNKFVGAMLCNGNAACFNQDPNNVMCPSYKVTKERMHSPKGRATLVKEWLRQKTAKQNETSDNKERMVAEITMQAMEGCLGCKGCAGKCPTQVSIPDLRSMFWHDYHKHYKRRNITQLINGYIEHLLPYIATFPRIWNFLAKYRLLPAFGLSHFPIFSSAKPLAKELKRCGVAVYSGAAIGKIADNAVVIFADVFTGLLEGKVLFAFIHVAKKLGYTPYVIYPRPSGKALIVGGFINQFKQNTHILSELFETIWQKNIPIVGLENTVTLMFRDEVNKFADKFNGKVLTIAEFLAQNCLQLKNLNIEISSDYCLLPHCTEQAVAPNEGHLWKSIFSNLGTTLEVSNLGCCGMAGSYGYQKEHQQHTRDLFNLNWRNHIVNTNVKPLATGFSCRSQAQYQAGTSIIHPVELISHHLQ